MKKSGKLKTQRMQVLIAPKDKETITRAADVVFSEDSSSAGSGSDVVRDGSLRLSIDLLGLKSGEYTLVDCLDNYKKLLLTYAAAMNLDDIEEKK